ncbi:SPOSA6832_02911 [Sporobolomyces salmonicolor]|uniref:SPOSA6832_02911-mRNA-1:cds n=1 Tax=Sporidiobolus salmonicolor TaxID=5005 RepID=A0A0D6EMW7_SPOSA|nr:SPOSA6832_02911 [Sporobolomyces salmonicolor]
MGFLRKAHRWLALPLALYLAFVAILIAEPAQRSLIYLHKVPLPWRCHYDNPELHGFSPGKVMPFTLTTVDGARLGAWHVLPTDIYENAVEKYGVPDHGPLPAELFDGALKSPEHPTVVYMHGNAGTRCQGNRLQVGRHMSNMGLNFVIIDYRHEGLLIDARRAFDYVHVDKKVPASQIVISGQSLGTGVSAGLAARLADEGITPRAVILVAPFSSIASLLETYRLGNIIPILSPLRPFPWLLNALLGFLRTRFDTKNVIEKIASPLLILHAQDDPVIPFSHSRALSEHLLGPLLSSQPASAEQEVEAIRKHLVKETKAGGWGTVSRYDRGEGKGEVVWAEARKGGHTEVATSEYALKLMQALIFKEKVSA